jgi:hypothetical protein
MAKQAKRNLRAMDKPIAEALARQMGVSRMKLTRGKKAARDVPLPNILGVLMGAASKEGKR